MKRLRASFVSVVLLAFAGVSATDQAQAGHSIWNLSTIQVIKADSSAPEIRFNAHLETQGIDSTSLALTTEEWALLAQATTLQEMERAMSQTPAADWWESLHAGQRTQFFVMLTVLREPTA